MSTDIPEHVRRFAGRHIASIAQLEVLLLLRASPETAWSAARVASQLRMGPEWAREQLRELATAKVLQDEDGSYRYAPSPRDRATIDELAQLFTARRIAVITLIASQPSKRIQSFTDAFRVRRDRPDG